MLDMRNRINLLYKHYKIVSFLPYKFSNLIMASDHEKGNFIGELKQDAILETGPDFPIVGMPVLQAKIMGEGSGSIKIIHGCIIFYYEI